MEAISCINNYSNKAVSFDVLYRIRKRWQLQGRMSKACFECKELINTWLQKNYSQTIYACNSCNTGVITLWPGYFSGKTLMLHVTSNM